MIVPVGRLWIFALVLVRLSGLATVAPVFSSDMIPLRIRALIVLVLSGVVCSSLPPQALPSLSAGVFDLGGEFLAGLVLGLGFRLAMVGVLTAAEIMGLQMGLGAGSLLDQNSGLNAGVLVNFYGLCFTLIFLTLDGHHMMLRLLAASFTEAHPGALTWPPVLLLVKQTGETFVFGCRLAAPIVIPLIILTLAAALISRAFPQANVMTVSYALSIPLGLLLLGASAPGFRDVVSELLQGATRQAAGALQAFGAG